MACSRLFGSLLALLVCCFGVGCDDDSPRDTQHDPGGLERGDRVVVESAAAEFFEGRVLSVQATELRVQEVAQGKPVTVATSDAYKVPVGRVEAAVGQFAICRLEKGRAEWVACKVTGQRERGYEVETAAGQRFGVAAGEWIIPTELTQLNIRHRFEDAVRRQEFRRRASSGGGPRAPPGWTPDTNEEVVVRHDAAWWTARTSRVEDGGVVVALPGVATTDAFQAERVVPLPPYEHVFEPGDFALRPPPVLSQPWTIVRVVELVGDELDVENDQGRRERVKAQDLVPLAP